jgi:hypothetical protein
MAIDGSDEGKVSGLPQHQAVVMASHWIRYTKRSDVQGGYSEEVREAKYIQLALRRARESGMRRLSAREWRTRDPHSFEQAHGGGEVLAWNATNYRAEVAFVKFAIMFSSPDISGAGLAD